MIETSFAELLATATSLSVFENQLPENFVSATNTAAVSYSFVTTTASYTLVDRNSFTKAVVQVNVHGFTGAARNALSKTIVDYLTLWQGTLGDGTVVQGIFQQPSMGDGFDADNRVFVRVLEFQINYVYQ